VIPNGVDLERFHPEGKREAVPTILFVGTYERRKRGRLLAEVFEREILPRVPEARLWMVCSDAPDRPGIEVLGRLSNAELADRYRRSWVFCLPSSYEGFGVPYIEAMASGTPVIATPNAGAREVLADGKFGLLADAENLGEAILSIIRSRSLAAELAQSGVARAEEYSWPSVIDRYEQVYLELLALRAARRSTRNKAVA
jgi:glycosyltransferase involved in cell wall biosynthesis